jgi:hypothetical protein
LGINPQLESFLLIVMAILKSEDGIIQVRLIRLSETNATLGYIDEYAKLNRSTLDRKLTAIERFIISEEIRFGIELVFRKGFCHGICSDRLSLGIRNLATGAIVYDEVLDSELSKTPINDDKTYQVIPMPTIGVGGGNANFTFCGLSPGDLIVEEPD